MCFWDTGEGMHTDMGTHYTDQMQWVLGTDNTGPVEFETSDIVWPDPVKVHERDSHLRHLPLPLQQRYSRRHLPTRGGFKDRYIRYIGDAGWIQVDDDTDEVTAERAEIHTEPEKGRRA